MIITGITASSISCLWRWWWWWWRWLWSWWGV